MKEVLGSLPEVITAYKNYNLLVPTATDVQLNPFYKFHVEEVPVDLGENSGDIFKVGSVKTGKQDERGKDIWEDVFSLDDVISTFKTEMMAVYSAAKETNILRYNSARTVLSTITGVSDFIDFTMDGKRENIHLSSSEYADTGNVTFTLEGAET